VMKNCEPLVFGPLFAMQSRLVATENALRSNKPRCNGVLALGRK
jgi:hypothetical protein